MRHEAPETERTPGRRVDFNPSPAPKPSTPTPAPEQEAPQEPIAPPSNLPTPEEASEHPLVQAVLKTFDGTVKNVYPRR
ncbi:MAG: hypothetical protein JJ974_01350 [Phycisphaerales bacterium]|nr:hypothetical protein [Phycisphaerales bacterium]